MIHCPQAVNIKISGAEPVLSELLYLVSQTSRDYTEFCAVTSLSLVGPSHEVPTRRIKTWRLADACSKTQFLDHRKQHLMKLALIDQLLPRIICKTDTSNGSSDKVDSVVSVSR